MNRLFWIHAETLILKIRKIVDEHAGTLDKQEVGLLPELQQHLKL